MKLKRTKLSICIWAVFLVFNVVMIASSGFFLGIFPAGNAFAYTVVFTVISVLIMSLLTVLLGKLCDRIDASELSNNSLAKAAYRLFIAALVIGGIAYRIWSLSIYDAADVAGKKSLYENAVIGAENVSPESNILSIFYSGLLRLILLFTGNKIEVAFYFQIFCFTVFVLCGYATVKKLLGMAAAFVFTAYVSFMPIFVQEYADAVLSTDSLFTGMFGIELLLVALYLSRLYTGHYRSKRWITWYLIVGAAIGFMTYVDAGTFIMIVPFIFAGLYMQRMPDKAGQKGNEPDEEVQDGIAELAAEDDKVSKKASREKSGIFTEILRIVCVLIGAVIAFSAMIIQEAGFFMGDVTLANWFEYYFHNLNTFSMFWTYTNYKVIYIITLIAMSGVIAGFWKNREVERVSPWLLSMLLIFATVPFMGATRMNTQTFVTIYYAFILGCVASLITLPAKDTSEVSAKEDEEMITDDNPEDGKEAVGESKTDEDGTNNSVKDSMQAASSEAEKPKRYVPEGMVLPEDDEDMDTEPRMKMPDFKGTIAVAKAKKPAAEEQVSHSLHITGQDKVAHPDFDIPLASGDDFDI